MRHRNPRGTSPYGPFGPYALPFLPNNNNQKGIYPVLRQTTRGVNAYMKGPGRRRVRPSNKTRLFGNILHRPQKKQNSKNNSRKKKYSKRDILAQFNPLFNAEKYKEVS